MVDLIEVGLLDFELSNILKVGRGVFSEFIRRRNDKGIVGMGELVR